jgi:hypothetical protein
MGNELSQLKVKRRKKEKRKKKKEGRGGWEKTINPTQKRVNSRWMGSHGSPTVRITPITHRGSDRPVSSGYQ